jgi:hypothetical protein
MPLNDNEAEMLRDISGRIRLEYKNVITIALLKRYSTAAVRRIIAEADAAVEKLDTETIHAAFDDLDEGYNP